ncbi:MAG: hypothetical protein HY865_26900, partial [Chloroflexi bacterium]|nr:hypothetical protein [Chloroflexota bacterium]
MKKHKTTRDSLHMNFKRHFGTYRQSSIAILLNILVILSMLLASCGSPEKQIPAAAQTETPVAEKAPEQNNYKPPVYTHPEPVTGVRPSSQSSPVDEPGSTQKDTTQGSGQDEPSGNGTKVSSTPVVPVPPKVSVSPMPEDNSKQQLNDMRQVQSGASSGSSSGSQSVMSGGMEWIIN